MAETFEVTYPQLNGMMCGLVALAVFVGGMVFGLSEIVVLKKSHCKTDKDIRKNRELAQRRVQTMNDTTYGLSSLEISGSADQMPLPVRVLRPSSDVPLVGGNLETTPDLVDPNKINQE